MLEKTNFFPFFRSSSARRGGKWISKGQFNSLSQKVDSIRVFNLFDLVAIRSNKDFALNYVEQLGAILVLFLNNFRTNFPKTADFQCLKPYIRIILGR